MKRPFIYHKTVQKQAMESPVKKVTLHEAAEKMKQMDRYYLVDVRDELEYITGHARGSILFPVNTINAQTAAEILPDKEVPVFVYCRSGARSKRAALILAALKYRDVFDMGSLAGWTDMEY